MQNGSDVIRVSPPRQWRDPSHHLVSALTDEWYRTITDLNAAIVNATFTFYRARAFYPTLMPVTVGSVSSPMGLGSDSLPVAVDLFGTRTYLADSMQFQLEFALRHRGPGAYYVMPTFRGEDPDRTHLNQFFHSEAELVGGFEEVLELVEAYTRDLAGALVRDCGPLIARIAGGVDHLERLAASGPLPRVTVDEARKILPEEMFHEVAPGTPTITRQGERTLADAYGGAVWLTHPPGLSVPFYQSVRADGRAECADLILGGCEVVGCGARWVHGDQVRAALAERGVDATEYDWYVTMKDRRPMRTAGFGLGVERFLLWALDHDDIRDLHVMPRLKGMLSWP